MKWIDSKPSQFNSYVENYPNDGAHLVYNTLRQSIIQLTDDGLQFLKALQSPTELPASLVPADISPDFVAHLKQQGFLVPRGLNEGERYLQSLWAKRDDKGGQLDITLLTNLDPCIHACEYCFEQAAHVGGRLKGNAFDRAIEFIKSQSLNLEVERLWVCFYGGEPLSYRNAIFDAAKQLKRFCRDHRIKFRFGMVTSGFLLTRELVEQLLPLGFCQAQITIDGPKEIHDKTRPLRSGKGSYDTIMKNFDAYAGLIHTDVLTVVHEDRIPAAYSVIDTLAERGFADRRVRMKFSPQDSDYRPETIQLNTQRWTENGTELLTAEKRLLLEIADLSIYAHEKGLIDCVLPEKTWCAMQRHDERHLVIEPSGIIRTCPNLIGRAEYAAGHVRSGVGGIDGRLKENYHRSQQCLECPFLPVCADCRVDTLQKTGDIFAPNTHIHEYELIVPKLVKAHYQSLKRRAG
jgi:uncharacterized protein